MAEAESESESELSWKQIQHEYLCGQQVDSCEAPYPGPSQVLPVRVYYSMTKQLKGK
jgi:hypothetical protein